MVERHKHAIGPIPTIDPRGHVEAAARSVETAPAQAGQPSQPSQPGPAGPPSLAVRPEPEGTRPRRGPALARSEPSTTAGLIPIAYQVFEEFLEEGRQAAEAWARPVSGSRPGYGHEPGPAGALGVVRVLTDTLEQLNGWSRLLQGMVKPGRERAPAPDARFQSGFQSGFQSPWPPPADDPYDAPGAATREPDPEAPVGFVGVDAEDEAEWEPREQAF